MVIMLIAGSAVLGHFIAVTNIPMLAADWISNLPLPRWIIMVIISMFYLLGGSFIDDLAFMILATPIFYPAIIKLGYDPMWFGMIIVITVMVALLFRCCYQRVCGQEHHQNTVQRDLCRGLPILNIYRIRRDTALHLPSICTFLPNLLYK